MDKVVSRAGIWLVVLFLAVAGMAAAQDSGFAIHMGIVATAALNGVVDKRVGHATHYHTDWVVPYWSASLEKITAVDTHLFFRWAGWWGTPPAFNRAYTGVEPNVPQLARLSPAHQGDVDVPIEPLLQGDGTIVDPVTIPDSAVPTALGAGADANSFVATLDRKMSPDAFAALEHVRVVRQTGAAATLGGAAVQVGSFG